MPRPNNRSLVTRVIVSTDDEEIAAVAREWGAETPFLRPAEFAQDKTTDLPVFEHALKWLEEIEGYHPDIVVQLRPTSPIRPRTMVDDAIRILLEHADADCVRGVVPAAQNPFKMWRFNGEGKPLNPLLEVEGIAEPTMRRARSCRLSTGRQVTSMRSAFRRSHRKNR